MRAAAILFVLMQCVVAVADSDNWETYLTEIYENEEEAIVQQEEAYQQLSELARQPLDINKVGMNELMLIPGLTPTIIDDILSYRHRYGNLRSIEELAMIPSIDRRLRLYLSNFLTVSPSPSPLHNSSSLLSPLHQEIVLTLQTPTYYRAGDRRAPQRTYLGNNKYAGKYLGDPTKHSVHYSLTLGRKMAFNLTGSKTAGEPFGTAGNNWGYDQYALNLSVRNVGRFTQVIAGHYRAQFGMGLILNNFFSIGKQGMLSAMGRRITTFAPHNSTSDAKHMQGIAASISLTPQSSPSAQSSSSARSSLSVFFSYRYIDATLNRDSTISSILTSGYHRTQTEMGKKNNSTIMTGGLHWGYDRGAWAKGDLWWGIGVGAVFSKLNRDMNPTYSKNGTVSQGRVYRLFYPRGRNFWNVSADYRLRWRELSLNGETAIDGRGNPATINSLTWCSPWGITFMALQRYYSYQYNALYGNSFSESGAVKNESGLYVGAQWNARRNLVVDAYTDIAYFPWHRYLVTGSSYAWDNSVTGTLTRGDWTFSLRYRLKMKQRDKTVEGEKRLLTRYDQRLRLVAGYEGNGWKLRSHVEGCSFSFNERSRGWIFSQSAGYRVNDVWEFYAHAAYFNTDDYDSRLYDYERGMRYSFGSASYYGRGMRCAFFAKCRVLSWLTAQGKVGHTRYFDRETIGTAERMIFSSYCTDIDVQVIVRL